MVAIIHNITRLNLYDLQLIHTHFAGRSTEIDIATVDLGSHLRTSTLGTGAGTDHDDAEIRVRPFFR